MFGVTRRHAGCLADTAEALHIPDVFAAAPKGVSLVPKQSYENVVRYRIAHYRGDQAQFRRARIARPITQSLSLSRRGGRQGGEARRLGGDIQAAVGAEGGDLLLFVPVSPRGLPLTIIAKDHLDFKLAWLARRLAIYMAIQTVCISFALALGGPLLFRMLK